MKKGKGNIAPKRSAVQTVLEDQFSVAVAYGKHVGAIRPDEAGEFEPVREVTLDKLLKEVLTKHSIRSNKDGPYITRPMKGDGTRSDANAGDWPLIPVDIDELLPNEVPVLMRWAEDSKLAGCMATTFSHRPEQPKVRLWLIGSRPITAGEHAYVHRALAQRVPFKMDPCMNKPSQPVFLPACPPETKNDAFAKVLTGEPIDVDRLLDGYRDEIAEEQRRRAERIDNAKTGVRQPGGLIDFVNQNLDLRELLEKHGYKAKGRNRFIAPASKSRRAAVVMYDHSVISFHDPAHDPIAVRNSFHQAMVLDAFAAYCKLEHNDDFKQAFAGAAKWARTRGWDDSTSLPDTEWTPPSPLVAKIAPKPYPVEALPDGIRKAVEEVQAFVKAPTPLVAVSALASLSTAAQGLYNVHRADRLTGPISLYLLTVADSGERKSTCDSFFTPSIREYEKQQAIVKKTDVQKYRAASASWEATRTGLLNAIREGAKNSKNTAPLEAQLLKLEGAKPQEPRVPKLLHGDSTSEHLAFTLAHRWPSGAVISSEGGLVFGSHSMGGDSIMRNLTLYNILWDGGTHDIGRRTSESFVVRGARLTVSLQVQGPTLQAFFEKSGDLARGTGFIARFLTACPESTQGHRPFTDPPPQWPGVTTFLQRIGEILSIDPILDAEGALMPQMLMLSAQAKTEWCSFHNAIEKELCSGGALHDVRDVASKAADNCARLAALFHIFSIGKNPPKGSAGKYISAEHMRAAAQIVRWHVHEARRFFGELALPDELIHAVKLDTWLVEYCQREQTHLVPIAKLQQFGPAGLRRREVIEKTIRELDELNRARLVRDGRKKMIAVNPALIRQGAT